VPVDTSKPLIADAAAVPTEASGQAARTARLATASSASAVAQVPQPGTDAAPESLTQSLQHVGARAKVGHDLAQSASDADTKGNSAANASTERADAKDARLLAAMDPAKSPQPTRSIEPALAPLLARQEKSQSERSALAVKQSEPAYSGTALGVSGPDFSQSAALAPAMAPDMQVAEQVTYWVTQNVQNAEMKLDGLGHSPVEVSISVQGNEAQIAFRSDEALTRGVLESAGAQLKDMLQREGMVLTGVSVGTSGSGDAGGSERRARQPVRQVTIAPLKAATAESMRGPRLQSGQSVDLFV
jgi:flagellar hook-length control protein FliK